MNWIINRLKEPSSWRGLIVLAGILGYSMSPELQEQIIVAGTALLGLVEVLRKEKADGKQGSTEPA